MTASLARRSFPMAGILGLLFALVFLVSERGLPWGAPHSLANRDSNSDGLVDLHPSVRRQEGRDSFVPVREYRPAFMVSSVKSYEVGPPHLLADSEEEIEWLQANGYPSAEEEEWMSSLSLGALGFLAEEGALPALAVYGRRLYLNGEEENGAYYLQRAINAGSIYAYYEISNINLAGGDLYAAGANLRAAQLLGDHKAASTWAGMAWERHDEVDDYMAAFEAAVLMGRGGDRQVVPRPISDAD